MFCSKCGNELKDDMIYCNKCGNKIGESKQEINNKVNKKNKVVKNHLKKSIIIALTIIALIFIIGISTVLRNNNKSMKYESSITESETSNLLSIEAINNKRENITLNVEEEGFTKQIKTDLSKFKESINGNNINIDSFESFGLFDSKNNKFEFINYVIQCRNSDNPNGLYYHIFSCYDTLIPYGIGNDKNLDRIVDDETMGTIYNTMNEVTNYNFKDDYYTISITEVINADLYRKLYSNANFITFDIETNNNDIKEVDEDSYENRYLSDDEESSQNTTNNKKELSETEKKEKAREYLNYNEFVVKLVEEGDESCIDATSTIRDSVTCYIELNYSYEEINFEITNIQIKNNTTGENKSIDVSYSSNSQQFSKFNLIQGKNNFTIILTDNYGNKRTINKSINKISE